LYRENERCRVSHETIYRSLYIQTRGVPKKELVHYLHSKPSMRRTETNGRQAGPNRRSGIDPKAAGNS